MPVVKLTQELIDSGELQCSPAKLRTEFCDSTQSGLYVLVSSKGNVRSYFLRFKSPDTGRTTHIKLGRTTDIDLDEARARAKTLRAEITLGKDPRADEKARKAVITFDEFFQEYYLPHIKVHNRGWKKKSQMHDLKLKKTFGNKRLDQVKRHEISSWHVSLREDGLSPAYADRFLALLRHALNMAVEWEMLQKSPAVGVKLFNIDNRIQRSLDDCELKRFLQVLASDRNRSVCQIILFLLSTGTRLNETLKAKWEDIDTVARVLLITASNSKSKKVRSVPLNDSALEVVAQLNTKDTFDYLFINRRTGKPYTTIHKTFSRLAAEAKLKDWTPHSCRHNYASLLVNGGRTLYEVQQILGHSDPKVTQRYAHLSTQSLQSAANSASDIISGAMPKST